ncbi:MAG: hypothetical protein IPK19_13950 [Chloroflexi bacterium]|nr:hypothetical protein [Chloroflexota bacterium]
MAIAPAMMRSREIELAVAPVGPELDDALGDQEQRDRTGQQQAVFVRQNFAVLRHQLVNADRQEIRASWSGKCP